LKFTAFPYGVSITFILSGESLNRPASKFIFADSSGVSSTFLVSVVLSSSDVLFSVPVVFSSLGVLFSVLVVFSSLGVLVSPLGVLSTLLLLFSLVVELFSTLLLSLSDDELLVSSFLPAYFSKSALS